MLPIRHAASVFRFALRPKFALANAETVGGVDLLTRTVEVHLNIETVFAASVAKVIDYGNLKLIDARAHLMIASVTDDIVATFAD